MSSPSYRMIMDPLAPSRTVGTHTCRRLLIMSLGLVLSIVAVTAASPDSGNLQAVGAVPAEISLASHPIRDEQAGPNDVVDRIRTEGTPQAEVRPPAIGTRRVEGWSRKILRDISPPGLWPTPDDVTPVVNDEFQRRSLVMGSTSAPPLGSPPLGSVGPLLVMHSWQDAEDSFLRQALVADKTYPVAHWSSIVNKLNRLGSVINISSLAFGIRLLGSLRVNVVTAGDSLEKMEHGDQDSFLPAADNTSPDPNLESEMQSRTGHFEESSTAVQQNAAETSEEPKFRSRRSLLQGDISPPGMWPDADDDESQLSESVVLRRRRLRNI